MTKDNKVQKAVALFYDGKSTPTVTAKGTGAVADNIIAVAEKHGVPLCDNSALVELLVQLELGDEIPIKTAVAINNTKFYDLNASLCPVNACLYGNIAPFSMGDNFIY